VNDRDVANLATKTIERLNSTFARLDAGLIWKLSRSCTNTPDRVTIAAPVTRDSFMIDYRQEPDGRYRAFRIFTFKPAIVGVCAHQLDGPWEDLPQNGSEYFAERATIEPRTVFDDRPRQPVLTADAKPSDKRVAHLLYQSEDSGPHGLDGRLKRFLESDESWAWAWEKLSDDVDEMSREVASIMGRWS